MTTNEQILVKLQTAMLNFSGASTVTHGDVTVAYESLDSLIKAISKYENLVAAENGTGAGRVPIQNNGRRLRS